MAKTCINDLLIFDVQPSSIIKKTIVKKVINSNKKIKTPADCKHILPAFNKELSKQWDLLTSENNLQAQSVISYLKGAAAVAKKKHPKEYEELKLLMAAAKKIIKKRK